jgi:hypothetical protein
LTKSFWICVLLWSCDIQTILLLFLLLVSHGIKLQNVEELVKDKYDAHFDKLISKGTPLETAKYCLDGRTKPGDVIPNEKGFEFSSVIPHVKIVFPHFLFRNRILSFNFSLMNQIMAIIHILSSVILKVLLCHFRTCARCFCLFAVWRTLYITSNQTTKTAWYCHYFSAASAFSMPKIILPRVCIKGFWGKSCFSHQLLLIYWIAWKRVEEWPRSCRVSWLSLTYRWLWKRALYRMLNCLYGLCCRYSFF